MPTKRTRKTDPVPSPSERMTAIENSVISAFQAFGEIKQLLGSSAVGSLATRVEVLERSLRLIQPTLAELLGELRAVRVLLDEKKELAHMDQPRPAPSDVPPLPERVL